MDTRRKSQRLRSRSILPTSVILPDELIFEILSWLTVKFLMQMKCVSKSWNTLISDPIFVKMHLSRSARNPQFSFDACTLHLDYSFVPFPVSNFFYNRLFTLPKDPYYQLKGKDCRRVVGSCNGLVCLLGYCHNQNNHTVLWLRFWNPATRKISDKLGYLHHKYGSNYWTFKFCYDNSSETYKVVAFRYKNFKYELNIFSLGDNVWRTIQTLSFVPEQIHTKFDGGVQFSCTLNWLAPNLIPSDANIDEYVIISFDLRTETYTTLMPPPGAEKMAFLSNVCVLMNFFCFSHDFNSTDFVIWKMTEFGEDKSWTQFFKFSYDNLKINLKSRLDLSNLIPLHLSEDGDTMVFVKDLYGQSIICTLRNNRVLKSRANKKIFSFSIKDYVESLVSPF